MQFFHSISVLLSVFSAVSAIPAPSLKEARSIEDPLAGLQKRAVTVDGFPPKAWKCLTNEKRNTYQTFLANYIEDTVNEGIRRRDADEIANKYPQYLTSPESIPGLEAYQGQTNIDHYPLNYNNLDVYNGGSPTSDARVVYQHDKGSSTAKFIGVWTHGGRKDGTFIMCMEGAA
ncbi:hypothetical protein HD806DRAFT_530358 [Xylariaceae sp. AK1471]|nr:hypothetical protein HD806DRAFT_530358 [Xylariaceae sp. AK1471]